MAGLFCYGGKYKTAESRLSKAFCEGVDAGAHGDNPHATGSDAFEAFDAGTKAVPGHEDVGCCADPPHGTHGGGTHPAPPVEDPHA